MKIENRKLKNANVSLDGDDGAVWLWITSGNEHAGINPSAQVSDPSMEEVVKQWARELDANEKINAWQAATRHVVTCLFVCHGAKYTEVCGSNG